MTQTISEVLQFIEENNIKFIRLAFCDIFGTMKNISIMPHELERAFACGVAVDAAAVQGFRHMEESDLLLLPDAGTLSILPWRSMEGRVARFYCNIQKPDGSFFCGDSRRILQEAAARCANLGYHCKIGPECEFYLLRTDENGDPTHIPMDNGGYCDISPLGQSPEKRDSYLPRCSIENPHFLLLPPWRLFLRSYSLTAFSLSFSERRSI